MPDAMAAAACPTTPHPPPPPYPTSPNQRRLGTPRLRAMAFSDVTWMLHLLMPSICEGRSPASSRARRAASSAVTSSERPMFFENGSCPIPTIAALSRNDTSDDVAGSGRPLPARAACRHRAPPGTLRPMPGLRERFANVIASPSCNLAVAALEIARIGHPDLDPAPTLQALDLLAAGLRPQLAAGFPPDEAARLLARYLFEESGFRGNRADYYDPR